jgi:hypothetical protein
VVASLADGADDDTRSRLKDLHSRYYRETAQLLRRLPGAQAGFENPRDLCDHLDSTAIGTLAKAVQTA